MGEIIQLGVVSEIEVVYDITANCPAVYEEGKVKVNEYVIDQLFELINWDGRVTQHKLNFKKVFINYIKTFFNYLSYEIAFEKVFTESVSKESKTLVEIVDLLTKLDRNHKENNIVAMIKEKRKSII
jgi:hypothetical protein